MIITEAKMFDGWLMVKPVQAQDAMRWLYRFKANQDYEIRQKTAKRSLDANAYCFVLIDKLAEKLNLPKNEIYRNAIRNIGGVSDTVCVPKKAVQRLISAWEKNGIGWQAETFPSKIDGCENVILYYGSSVYDTKQMSRLIESIIEDCKAVGIDTKTKEEVDSLLKHWR